MEAGVLGSRWAGGSAVRLIDLRLDIHKAAAIQNRRGTLVFRNSSDIIVGAISCLGFDLFRRMSAIDGIGEAILRL